MGIMLILIKQYFMDSLLDKEMFTYFKRLSEEEKRSLLQLLKSFLGRRNESTGRATLEQYNKEIDDALEDVEKGNFLTQEEVEARAAKW
jgi:predicted transcriptional regulator